MLDQSRRLSDTKATTLKNQSQSSPGRPRNCTLSQIRFHPKIQGLAFQKPSHPHQGNFSQRRLPVIGGRRSFSQYFNPDIRDSNCHAYKGAFLGSQIITVRPQSSSSVGLPLTLGILESWNHKYRIEQVYVSGTSVLSNLMILVGNCSVPLWLTRLTLTSRQFRTQMLQEVPHSWLRICSESFRFELAHLHSMPTQCRRHTDRSCRQGLPSVIGSILHQLFQSRTLRYSQIPGDVPRPHSPVSCILLSDLCNRHPWRIVPGIATHHL